MKLGNEVTSGSLLGSTLLIAGSCIGIGTLGLPVNTAMAGFQPAVVMFFDLLAVHDVNRVTTIRG